MDDCRLPLLGVRGDFGGAQGQVWDAGRWTPSKHPPQAPRNTPRIDVSGAPATSRGPYIFLLTKILKFASLFNVLG